MGKKMSRRTPLSESSQSVPEMVDELTRQEIATWYKDGKLTPENVRPRAKNPIIAGFFREIGGTDRPDAGSGTFHPAGAGDADGAFGGNFNYMMEYESEDKEISEAKIKKYVANIGRLAEVGIEEALRHESRKVTPPSNDMPHNVFRSFEVPDFVV